MAGSPSQARDVPPESFDNILRSFHEWRVQMARADENRKVLSVGDDMAEEEAYIAPRIAPLEPSIVPDQRATVEEIKGSKPSVARRIFRTFIYGFVVAALVTVAWQAYKDDSTKGMISAWLSATSRSVDPNVAAAPKTSDQAAVLPQSAVPVGAEVSKDVQLQLQTVVNELAVVRRTVEQIASKQEQMGQDIAALQAAQRDVTLKVVSLTQAAAAQRKIVQKIAHPEHASQPPSITPPVAPPPARTPPPPQ